MIGVALCSICRHDRTVGEVEELSVRNGRATSRDRPSPVPGRAAKPSRARCNDGPAVHRHGKPAPVLRSLRECGFPAAERVRAVPQAARMTGPRRPHLSGHRVARPCLDMTWRRQTTPSPRVVGSAGRRPAELRALLRLLPRLLATAWSASHRCRSGRGVARELVHLPGDQPALPGEVRPAWSMR